MSLEGYISSMSVEKYNFKVGCIVPDRKDRPFLLKNCLRMLSNQSIKPDIIEIIDDEPLNDKCDITWRYRNGYERLRNKGLDVIFLIENDDFYAKNYIETCLIAWENNNKPDLFGQTSTIYYHIKLFKHFTMHHHQRSSAMNTLIKPDLNITWGQDADPYTDAWLWYHMKNKKLFTPKEIICMGIKHGVGMLGGNNHISHLDMYKNDDSHKTFLKHSMDKESFDFYSAYFKG